MEPSSLNIIIPKESQDFLAFSKIPRLNRDCVITEKIDGTNAQINILEDGTVLAGSRSRYITPEDDNYGFAKWVKKNEEELRVGLGFGRHFGEWWGQGINGGYGLKEKRFSLFNTGRWTKETPPPSICHVVPVLYEGPFSTNVVKDVIDMLTIIGSVAAPGFMNPEGVIVYHKALNGYFKVTVNNDEAPKSAVLDKPKFS